MKIWTMGEILVEIMRPGPDMPLGTAGTFLGPYPSGAPAIFADTAARLGHQSGIIGGVGDDDFGHCVLNRLKSDGVDTTLVRRGAGASTAVAFVAYDSAGERKFIYHIGNTPAAQALCPSEQEVASPAPAFFHVMGCSLMADEAFCGEILKAAALFHRLGAKISFDPNIRPELLKGRGLRELIAPVMADCAVLLPGLEELRMISGKDNADDATRMLFENPRLEIIALKLGKDGCRVITRDSDISLPVYAIDPVDPTGAGDCFDAGFLCGILDGMPPIDAAKHAAAAAALNTAAFGPMEGNISPASVRNMKNFT
ncbi:MAG: sugar kinase [Defluviitaleaceae bacterium]|nr:sugar kinase [Defluviitaleaceae bacterium]MCL2836822.1 sugar kinase [Defluviitaleaceae bacterium]